MTTAELPAAAYFPSGQGPVWDSVDPPGLLQQLNQAGFANCTATGQGTTCTALSITPPGQSAIQISPTSGGPNHARYDLATTVAVYT
jgi:hypothetical protein